MTDKMEQAFLDGTHPALTRDAQAATQAATTLREQPLASEQEDHHSQHSDDGGEQDTPAPPPQPPLRETTNARTQPSQPAARRRGEESRNTGVKGVKADYAEAMARQQQQQQPQLARSLERNLKLNDEEEDELALMRRKRLAELQGSGERRAAAGHAARSFGHLSEVGMEGFVAAVEDEDPETAVVVHLYEPVSPLPLSLRDGVVISPGSALLTSPLLRTGYPDLRPAQLALGLARAPPPLDKVPPRSRLRTRFHATDRVRHLVVVIIHARSRQRDVADRVGVPRRRTRDDLDPVRFRVAGRSTRAGRTGQETRRGGVVQVRFFWSYALRLC